MKRKHYDLGDVVVNAVDLEVMLIWNVFGCT